MKAQGLYHENTATGGLQCGRLKGWALGRSLLSRVPSAPETRARRPLRMLGMFSHAHNSASSGRVQKIQKNIAWPALHVTRTSAIATLFFTRVLTTPLPQQFIKNNLFRRYIIQQEQCTTRTCKKKPVHPSVQLSSILRD